METDKMFYSSKCLRPTQDDEGNDTSVMGFFWKYDHATYWNDTKKVDVVVSWVVDSNQKAKFLWKETFDCEGQWSKDMCIEAVKSRPLFSDSSEFKVVIDNPETEVNEEAGTPWYSKMVNFIKSPSTWFK